MSKENESINDIKKSLIDQLEKQNKDTRYNSDMVDDYIYLWRLKEICQRDIEENGIRLAVQSGNGFTTEKPNESVLNVLKINMQMLKILSALNLKVEETQKKGSPY